MILQSFALLTVLTGFPGGTGAAAPSHCYYYFKEAQPLTLEASRLALKRTANAPAASGRLARPRAVRATRPVRVGRATPWT